MKSYQSGCVHWLYSPDYSKGNSYQRILYKEGRAQGSRISGISASDVPALLRTSHPAERPSLFHQHWLMEIYKCHQPDEQRLTWIRSYFDSLRHFQLGGGKIIWTVHNLIDHDLNDDERELNLFCLKQMAEITDVILVHSTNTTRTLERLVGCNLESRTRLLKHPLYDSMLDHVDFLPIELRVRCLPSGLKFLAFGLQRPYKGTSDLLQAFTSLIADGELRDASLIIAGSIHDPNLRRMLKNDGQLLRQVVVIDRRLSDSELASLCSNVDVAVLPYRKILVSGSYYQAVTFGLPCIVPDIGMFQSEVKNGETGLKYGPKEGLRPALVRAQLIGRRRLKAIGTRALTECSEQTEQKVALQFHHLAQALLDQPFKTLPDRQAGASAPRRRESGPVKLSFCIPVMNRLNDLKATLRRNLDDNRASKGRVEFIVVCFDQDDPVEKWIKNEFEAELEEEYLRFYRAETLDYWHFGRAKNAFKDLFRGEIYASLDADNFTGFGGGEHIIDVFEAHDHRCVFHQFQGEWGDGTCGRISLDREDYLACGYDERFLPRQWDELDALLSILVQRPDRSYICYRGKSIIDKSQPFRRFLEDHAFSPPIVELNPELNPLFREQTTKAVGVHDNDYVKNEPILRYSSVFNHLQSFFKNSGRDDLQVQYVSELVEVQRKLIEEVRPAILESWVFRHDTHQPVDISDNDIVAVACVRNELALEDWYDHYRRLGVTRFLIVDDGSDVPVKESLPVPDVHVWKPIVGQFRHAKAFWLEILLATYCRNLWCLTIDGDEYLSLPEFPEKAGPSDSPLRRSVTVAEASGEEYFGGFLLDMIADSETVSSGKLERESFRYYQYLDNAPDQAYKDQNTVRWSYGDKADWAFRIDVRYRINNSLDSLRKFPLIRYREGIHLNQGFHDLIIDGKKRSSQDLSRSDLIPVIHHKLWVLSQSDRTKWGLTFDAYHHEARENLLALTDRFGDKMQAAADVPNIYPYLGFALIPTPSHQSITVQLNSEQNEDPDSARLARESNIVFHKRDSIISLDGYSLFGPSEQSAIDWLREITPFTVIAEQSASLIRLSTVKKESCPQS